MRLSTIRAYVKYVAEPFIIEFSDCNPRLMDTNDWVEKLNIVSENVIAPTKKHYVIYFAEYLVNSRLVIGLDINELDIQVEKGKVKVNLITQTEADRVIDCLENENKLECKLAVLIFCFAFYSGLRRRRNK